MHRQTCASHSKKSLRKVAFMANLLAKREITLRENKNFSGMLAEQIVRSTGPLISDNATECLV